LADVVSRLLGLEKRVSAVERRLDILENGPKDPPTTLPMIEITSPRDGDQVGRNVTVKVIMRVDDLANRSPIVAVHPLLSNLVWIQPPPAKVDKVKDGFKFQCRVFCGTPNEGLGEEFELIALLPEKGTLVEGNSLDGIPDDIPASPVVLVKRTRN
jgi:hypothetical protein